MTPQELFNKSPLEIRNSEPLMGFFLELFKEAYGYVPNCAGCTFNGYYNQLKDKYITKNSLNLTINNFNSMRTFILKRGLQNKQFMYKENNRPVRTYGNIMTDDFAIKYLTWTRDYASFEKAPDGFNLNSMQGLPHGGIVRESDTVDMYRFASYREQNNDSVIENTVNPTNTTENTITDKPKQKRNRKK